MAYWPKIFGWVGGWGRIFLKNKNFWIFWVVWVVNGDMIHIIRNCDGKLLDYN
jgi:hypothetical protein